MMRTQSFMRGRLRGAAIAFAIAGTGFLMPAPQASAQGLLDALFGVFRPAPRYAPSPYAPPEAMRYAPADRVHEPGRGPGPDGDGNVGSARASAFCVRTCDGRYFPVQGSGRAGAEDMCRAFCPATQTKTFYGSAIGHARARDGRPYADLANAYLYREKFVGDCSCNGRDPTGLARVDISQDATLRRGDVVATNDGFVAYSGSHGDALAFTPIGDVRDMSTATREQLEDTRVTPTAATDIDMDRVVTRQARR